MQTFFPYRSTGKDLDREMKFRKAFPLLIELKSFIWFAILFITTRESSAKIKSTFAVYPDSFSLTVDLSGACSQTVTTFAFWTSNLAIRWFWFSERANWGHGVWRIGNFIWLCVPYMEESDSSTSAEYSRVSYPIVVSDDRGSLTVNQCFQPGHHECCHDGVVNRGDPAFTKN